MPHTDYVVDGKKYPSVTEILKIIQKNDSLMRWANSLGFRRINLVEYQTSVMEFGTIVHSRMQAIVDPNFTEVLPGRTQNEEALLADAERRFRLFTQDLHYETIFTEKALISTNLGYAGTCDWYARINNQHDALIDFKTSKTIHDTMYLQLGGYYNLLRDAGYHVDIAAILLINLKDCSIHPINQAKLERYGEIFLQLVEFYRNYTSQKLQIDRGLI
jgi:hypothetical protein